MFYIYVLYMFYIYILFKPHKNSFISYSYVHFTKKEAKDEHLPPKEHLNDGTRIQTQNI